MPAIRLRICGLVVFCWELIDCCPARHTMVCVSAVCLFLIRRGYLLGSGLPSSSSVKAESSQASDNADRAYNSADTNSSTDSR